MAQLLYNLDDMLERMNKRLQSLAKAAYEAADIKTKVYGVFSLDDLETQMKGQLTQGTMGIGVSYEGAQRSDQITNTSNATMRPGAGRASIDFYFLIVLAVRSDDCCEGKFNGTALLQILRRGIFSQHVVDPDAQEGIRPELNRQWDFVKEGPETSASGPTMIYYSQVWRANVPVTGNQPS